MKAGSNGSGMKGFHRLGVGQRRMLVADQAGIPPRDIERVLEGGGLDTALADKLVENVLGTYALPFAVATNFRVDGRDVLVPMVIEEPSVVAAASHGAKLIREGGGFRVEVDPPLMVCQVAVEVPDPEAAARRVAGSAREVLDAAAAAVPGMVARGGGPREIETRLVPGGDGVLLVVHLLADVRDAMGANAVNAMGEAAAGVIGRLAGGRVLMSILTNLADRRMVSVAGSVPVDRLARGSMPGITVAQRIEAGSRMAASDPYRAATHNKGVMNGVDAVLVATGNDWRAVEAGAHAHAASGGGYGPLCNWRVQGMELKGSLTMPMAVGVVGGAAAVHPAARLALRIMGASSASRLAGVAGAAGMACNLAAILALCTEGIQRGHMELHRRSRP